MRQQLPPEIVAVVDKLDNVVRLTGMGKLTTPALFERDFDAAHIPAATSK